MSKLFSIRPVLVVVSLVAGFVVLTGLAVTLTASPRRITRSTLTGASAREFVRQRMKDKSEFAVAFRSSPRGKHLAERLSVDKGRTSDESNLVVRRVVREPQNRFVVALASLESFLGVVSVEAKQNCEEMMAGPAPKPGAQVSRAAAKFGDCEDLEEVNYYSDVWIGDTSVMIYAAGEIVTSLNGSDMSSMEVSWEGDYVGNGTNWEESSTNPPYFAMNNYNVTVCSPTSDTWHGIPCYMTGAIANWIVNDMYSSNTTARDYLQATGGAAAACFAAYGTKSVKVLVGCVAETAGLALMADSEYRGAYDLMSYELDCVLNIMMFHHSPTALTLEPRLPMKKRVISAADLAAMRTRPQ